MAVPSTPWGEALTAALAANDDRDQGPTSISALARAMSEAGGGSPTPESWRNTLTGIRRGETVTERTAQIIAAALQVDRSTLPPPTETPTVAALLARLESVSELAVLNAENTDRIRGALEDLGRGIQARLDEIESRVRALER